MKNIIILFTLVFTSALYAQDRSIEFRDLTFEEALTVAHEEGKPIFMDCFAEWCGPCKWMSANIFTQNDVADYFNKNFICLKKDMEKGEGVDLAQEFGIRAYPTLIFVDADRNLVMKNIGASRNTGDYIELGENALSEEYNLIALAAQVADKRKDAAFMSKYFKIMSGADMVDQDEVSIYFANIPREEWSNDDNWEIIISVVDDIQGDVFQDVLTNTENYRKAQGEIVDQFIDYKIQNALMSKLYSRSPDALEQYQKFLALVETWEFNGKDAIIFGAESARLKRESPESYMAYCYKHVEKYVWDDANQLNNIAWYFFENTTDAEYLIAAEKWAKQATELNPAHHILDTYANVLMANGKYKEALTIETKAAEMAEAEGADASSYKEVIAEIKSKI